MRSHIDWLTFTMTMQYGAATRGAVDFAEEYALAMEQTFLHTFGADLVAKAFGGNWEKNEKSRAPYTDSWKLGQRGITLFASPSLTHACVEISGQGCELLIQADLMGRVLNKIHDRVTRIDIASDILTNTRPTEFISETSHKRMRASGFQKSETGETCYVGSQKSDRYSRVYRYAPPHPRSALLRVECVYRREQAKIVAKSVLTHGIDNAAQASAAVFGWAHRDWGKVDELALFDTAVKGARENGKTVFWLVTAAASAFKRLCAEGEITDPEEFLQRHFLSQ